MNNTCQVKEEYLVILDTRNASTYYNGSMYSDVEWDLSDVISKPKKAIQYSVSVVNASIPIGQYNIQNIDNTENTVTIVDSGYPNPIILTIPNGNYTITSLLTDIQSRGPSQYVWTYIPYKNRISVSNPNVNFTLTVSNSLYEPLGFSKGVTYTSTSKSITSPNCVNMSGLKAINIHLDNVNTKSISSFTKSTSTIIGNIPVDVNSGGVVSYSLSNNYEIPVPINSLDSINIVLKDDVGHYINQNGISWAITLKMSYILEVDMSNETINDTINRNKQKINIIQPKKILTGVPDIFGKSKLEE
jgi:hypothetical protein